MATSKTSAGHILGIGLAVCVVAVVGYITVKFLFQPQGASGALTNGNNGGGGDQLSGLGQLLQGLAGLLGGGQNGGGGGLGAGLNLGNLGFGGGSGANALADLETTADDDLDQISDVLSGDDESIDDDLDDLYIPYEGDDSNEPWYSEFQQGFSPDTSELEPDDPDEGGYISDGEGGDDGDLEPEDDDPGGLVGDGDDGDTD